MNRKIAAIRRLAAGLLILAGCTNNSPQFQAEQRPDATSADAEANPRSLEARESWDVYVLQGKRVGYGHTTIRRQLESGLEVVRTENVSRLTLRRGTDVSEQVISGTSVETPRGELIGFQSEIRMGPGAILTFGSAHGKKLDIMMLGPGETKPKRILIPWSSDYFGPFATEQTLLRRPMKPGQRRAFKTIVIGFNQVADVELTAKDFESVKLPNGMRELLRVETLTRLPDGQQIKGTLWCDRSGDTLKTYSEAMGLETFRVSKAEALKKTDAAELDLLPSMMVEVQQPLSDPHRTKRVRYRVQLERGDPAKSFVTGPTQSVKSIDPHTAEITVYAIRPGQAAGNPDAPAEQPTDDDLRPNNFIQSDDPLIRANAQKAAGDEKDPWRAAVALERFVHDEVKDKNFTQAFATAAEVARSREGDCTEHAVYLAALARARGIPARLAIGLVYIEGRRAFGFHAWTEVYVKDRWIPIDGTLAHGGIGAAHLKIAASNLKEASVYNALLPVVKLIGGLRIEIVDIVRKQPSAGGCSLRMQKPCLSE
ncbi:MAG: transglutaminase family protein [Planctomycetes bacterium]|nr:transglutaminase family protein [Planctomycetota bacterium]